MIAYNTVKKSTHDPDEPPMDRSALARALGALGASKGGKARAAALSPAKKKAIAKAGAKARWDAHRAAKAKKGFGKRPKQG